MSFIRKFKKLKDFSFDENVEEKENKKINKKQPSIKIAEIREMSVLDIIDQIIQQTAEQKLQIKGILTKYLKVLSEKLNITPIQALFLSVFVEQCDDNGIRYRDLAKHFDSCRTVEVIKYKDEIDDMVKRGIILQSNDRHDLPTFRIPHGTLVCLCKNTLPTPPEQKCSTLSEWLESIDKLLERVSDDELEDEEFDSFIKENFKNNQHLTCVQKIKELNLSTDDLKLFLAMSMRCIIHDDNCIRGDDVSEYFNKYEFRWVQRNLEDGDHYLMQHNLVEHACDNGQANPKEWCLTAHAKSEIYGEFKLDVPKVSTKLKSSDSIVKKDLYYDGEVSRLLDTLKSMLEPERMNLILEKLANSGMRKGFACLFYGGPGTGKTETVLQLARETGRSIMQVDIATIRDKWVGETEKRIKACFDSYRKEANKCELAPILFFNEADALFTTRNENAEYGVDKMENAMQNIILQEMETLEGILIATTNLTGSLDPAFERRFLFKIEFTKPSPDARRHIWQAMMPGLSDADALMLAKTFDFSGGQIENIARKRIIDDILAERDTIDIDAIIECCRHETLDKQENMIKIGFVA